LKAVIRRFVVPASALLCSACLLDDPYFIDQDTAAQQTGDDAADAPGTATETTLPEPEPGQASSTPETGADPTAQPEPGLAGVEPVDILMDPTVSSTAPEPTTPGEPQPGTPEPTTGASNDAGVNLPEPAVTPAPEPTVTPEVDAGSAECTAGTPGCTPMSGCGNSVAEGQEACDGDDLGESTCAGEGFSGGQLRCTASCELDTSQCLTGPPCDEDLGTGTGLVFQGSLSGQGNDTRSYSCSAGGRQSADLSFSWTAPSSGCFDISVDSTQAIDTVIGMYDDCRLSNEIGCDDERGSTNPDSILQFDAVANTTYAFSVDAYAHGDEGPIDVTISPCLTIPPEWNCVESRYAGGQGCDCGCGALDPDCLDETVDSCDNCGPPGSCSSLNCYLVDPEQNWTCGGYNMGGPFGR
jgi:hypothetical protein